MLWLALFWLSAAAVVWVYLGFPALAILRDVLRTRRLRAGAPGRPGERVCPEGPPLQEQLPDDALPRVTLLIAAYNEADILAEKVANSRALDYPAGRLQVAFVLDGTADDSAERLADCDDVTVFFRPERRGKSAAIQRVIPLLDSDVVVLSDANAMYRPDAIRRLVAHYADDRVAMVSGEKRVLGGGEGLYWRYENRVKQAESRLHSALGGVGEIISIRRDRFVPPPEGAIIEDFHMVMEAIGAGWRHVFEPAAISEEEPSLSAADDLERRTRIAAGGFQSSLHFRHMLNPLRFGWIAVAFGSHRVMRWVVVPVLLWAVLPLSAVALAVSGHALYVAAAVVQVVLLASVLLDLPTVGRIHRTLHFLYLSNLAAVRGGVRFLTGRQAVTWQRVQRRAPAS